VKGKAELVEASRFFCSELSRRAAEKTFGTASIGAVWLLLEYPHGWGKHAFEDSSLLPRVKEFFAAALARIPHSRILLVKRDRARREVGINFFVVRCRERAPFVVRFRLESYEQATLLDLASVASGENLQGGVLTQEPLFLVCTHGRRDKCCAKFGVPLYNALRESADAVWQSSHIGGDRFAANLACFPHGLFYAHVNGDAGRMIVSAYRERRIVLEHFRGRACYSHHVQAAEFFVRSETGLAGVDDLRHLASERTGDKSWLVRLTDPHARRVHEARVSCRMSEFRNFITCHAAEQKNVPQFSLDDYRIEG
jgi:hypothetical protein